MKKSDAKKIEKAIVSSACGLGGVGLITHGLHNLMKSEGKAMNILLGLLVVILGGFAIKKSVDIFRSDDEMESGSSDSKVNLDVPCLINKVKSCVNNPLGYECSLVGDNSCIEDSVHFA